MLEEHQHYLADRERLAVYERALNKLVKPGAIVLDLGAGTGILGLIGCKAGAGHVYVVDSGPMLEIARANYRANGFEARATFIRSSSLRAALPEKVDLVVADQMGPLGVEARLVEVFSDARERFLVPGGILVPGRLTLHAALSDPPDACRQVSFWENRPAGLDFTAMRRQAVNSVLISSCDGADLLSDAVDLVDFDLMKATDARFSAERVLTASRSGTVHGVTVWFTAQLSPGTLMTNSPLAGDRINRRQAFFPLAEPVVLRAGEMGKFQIRATPYENLYTWTLVVDGSQAPVLPQSTFFSLLPARAVLRRTDPDHVPTLMPRAQARSTVLRLCNGERSLRDIESEVQRSHRDLFPTAEDAATFVAEALKDNDC